MGFTQTTDPQFCLVDTEAKLWTADGAEITLPGLAGATGATAFAINNRGEVVGDSHFTAPCEEDASKVRAVIWRAGRISDLNSLVPKAFARKIQLTYASAINDRGQIAVRGIRRGEPRVRCPIWDYNPETGEDFYNDSRMCHNELAFLLTPER